MRLGGKPRAISLRKKARVTSDQALLRFPIPTKFDSKVKSLKVPGETSRIQLKREIMTPTVAVPDADLGQASSGMEHRPFDLENRAERAMIAAKKVAKSAAHFAEASVFQVNRLLGGTIEVAALMPMNAEKEKNEALATTKPAAKQQPKPAAAQIAMVRARAGAIVDAKVPAKAVIAGEGHAQADVLVLQASSFLVIARSKRWSTKTVRASVS